MKAEQPVSAAVEMVKQLRSLARAINSYHEAADEKAGQTRKLANEALSEAVLCGEALIRAKGMVKHGQWLPWLERNCSNITQRTAQKYMRLANTNHGSLLATACGIRQAYVTIGILPETKPGEAKAWELSLEALSKWSGWFRAKVSLESVLTWSEEQRARLKEQIAPVVELYHRL